VKSSCVRASGMIPYAPDGVPQQPGPSIMSTSGPAPEQYANQSEPFFVIDQRQRIVEWNAEASALLGISAHDAIGRFCFEVVQGSSEQGQPVCRADCPAFSALDEGELSAGAALVIERGARSKRRIRCELAALPHGQGALATLSERSKPAEASTTAPSRERRTDMSADLLHTLLAFAHLSTALATDQLESSIEQALDLLRKATGADSAELFLAEPTSHDALLTAYRGPFARSFCQLMRFSPGEGFPGVVIERHEPMVSSTLSNDVRFLREEVKKKGYRSYVCVPLLVAQQVIGAIGVGARHPEFSTEDALRLLTWSSAPVAIAVQAGLIQASRTAMPPLPAYHGTPADLDLFLHSVLQQARYLAGADGGTITVFGRNGNEIVRRVADGVDPSLAGCCPDRIEHQQGCPALNGGHGIALWGPRRHWSPPCQHFSQPGRAAYCLPMRHNDDNVGLIQLVYHDTAPLPPTRHVGLLLEYASQVSSILALIARDLKERSKPSLPVLSLDPSVESCPSRSVQMPDPIVPSAEAPAHGPQFRPEPFLQIRCLGPFEIVRNGKLLTSRAFKRRKALTLLKIMVLRADRPIARETLIEWLWPEIDPDLGANRLHVVVHALREVLEPAISGNNRRFIQTDGNNYIFEPLDACRLDLAEFKTAVEAGQRAEERHDPAAAIAAYDTAVERYRGDLFEDDDFAEWCLLDREYLRETYLSTLQRLAALFEKSGNHDRAIAHCRRIIRVDPLRETTQRQLIECLWQAGRRDEALQQYDAFARSLRHELDIAPLPETQRLVQRIRQNAIP